MTPFRTFLSWLFTSLGLALLICSLVLVPSGTLRADGGGGGVGNSTGCVNSQMCDPSNNCNNQPQPCPGNGNCRPVGNMNCQNCECLPATPNGTCQCNS